LEETPIRVFSYLSGNYPPSMKNRNFLLNLIFLFLALVVLYGAWKDDHTIEYFSKPLIMICLAVYFLINTKRERYRWTVPFAMSLSWAGDVLLMFAWKNEMWFFAGVGAFLFSQLAYIMVFRKYGLDPGLGFMVRKPVYLIPFAIYFIAIFLLVLPGLEGIMIAIVLMYAITLISMSIAAFNRYGRMPARYFNILFIGSVLFVISDSLLAVNKFLTELPMSGVLVMSTYIGAQYLIMRGLAGKAGGQEGRRARGQEGRRAKVK